MSARDVLRERPREDEQHAPGGFAADEFLVQHDREEDADGDMENDVHHRPDDRLAQDRPEELLLKNRRVLREADQSPIADVIDVRVRKRENDVEEKREEDDRENDEQRGREEEGNEKPGS